LGIKMQCLKRMEWCIYYCTEEGGNTSYYALSPKGGQVLWEAD
jgi:hypothetical protein